MVMKAVLWHLEHLASAVKEEREGRDMLALNHFLNLSFATPLNKHISLLLRVHWPELSPA